LTSDLSKDLRLRVVFAKEGEQAGRTADISADLILKAADTLDRVCQERDTLKAKLKVAEEMAEALEELASQISIDEIDNIKDADFEYAYSVMVSVARAALQKWKESQ